MTVGLRHTLWSMKSRLLLGALLVTLVSEGAAAMPLKADSNKPVAFWPPGIGTLDSSFHPHRDRNHVFYVGSRKQARAVGLTKILPIAYDPYYNFKKYGLLVIFYKGQAAGFGAGFEPKIEFIEESAAGDLSAKVDIACYNATSCGGHQPDPSHPWGILIEVLIVKQSLLAPPKTVHVTTVPV
jgi:hypothetical protein